MDSTPTFSPPPAAVHAAPVASIGELFAHERDCDPFPCADCGVTIVPRDPATSFEAIVAGRCVPCEVRSWHHYNRWGCFPEVIAGDGPEPSALPLRPALRVLHGGAP